MPANVTFEFGEAKQKYENAKTPDEKLAALQEMWSTAPGHKGGENLRREISKKIAAVRREIEKVREQQKKTSRESLHIKKEGAGQIAVVGLPNSGKSFLLKKLTNADVEVSAYPFTTKKPEVGMAAYKGAKTQLVEIPAIIEGSSQGKAQGPRLLSIIRNADAIALVLNAASALQEFNILKRELEAANIRLNESRPKIEIKTTKFRGITIAGKNLLKVPEEKFIDFLKGMGIYNAEVILNEETTIEKVIQTLNERIIYKPGICILNSFYGKTDENERKELARKNPVIELREGNEEELKKQLFLLLNKIIIFTKRPGQEADYSEPMVLPKGSKIEDAAKLLHKDFVEKMRFARVWGSTKFQGQRVSKDYKLQNEDLVEID